MYMCIYIRMEELHSLWLQRNQLEKLPGNIVRMQRLDTLVLSSNCLRDIPPLMEDMSNLRSACTPLMHSGRGGKLSRLFTFL